MVIFFAIILTLIITAVILIRCSTFKIDIKQLIIINAKIKKFNIIISLNLFNKIKWLKLTINNKRLTKIKNSSKLKAFNKILDTKVLRKFKNAKQILIKDWKHVLKNLSAVDIEMLELKSKISTQNAATTAISVGVISTLLATLLARKIQKLKYKIEPMYIDKNYIYLSINCIIAVKLVHIINMNKKLGKEVYQAYGRKSNRRAYANSNG